LKIKISIGHQWNDTGREELDNTKQTVTVPFRALEISRELAMHRTLAFAYRQRWSWHGLHVCLRLLRLQRRRTSEKTLCCHKGHSCCVSHRQRYCTNICTNRLVTFTYTRSKHLMKMEKLLSGVLEGLSCLL
jgi:hypothetical protein